jgi:uncharacterized protein (DUF2267 family)
MSKTHIFDPHVDTAVHWLHELRDYLGLEPGQDARALQALRVGLHAIRNRLPANEVLDLAAQLPLMIRGIFFDGWRIDHAPKRIRHRGAWLTSIKNEIGYEPLQPLDVLRAVIRLLTAHVSDGELADIVATLPRPLAELWRELGGQLLVAIPAAHTTHTGYSR